MSIYIYTTIIEYTYKYIKMHHTHIYHVLAVWWGTGKDIKAGDIPNIAGVLCFIAAFMANMSICVLPAFLEDKVIMIKERANGCCKC